MLDLKIIPALTIVLFILLNSSMTSCQQNPYAQGKKIYDAVCANCHMENGEGLGTMFPPLNNSDYLEKNWEKFACTVKNGMKGEIIVNGKTYNELMPANASLTAAEITNIINYIQTEWYEKPKPVSIKDIEAQLSSCK